MDEEQQRKAKENVPSTDTNDSTPREENRKKEVKTQEEKMSKEYETPQENNTNKDETKQNSKEEDKTVVDILVFTKFSLTFGKFVKIWQIILFVISLQIVVFSNTTYHNNPVTTIRNNSNARFH